MELFFHFVLNTYISKDKTDTILSIKDIPSYIQKMLQKEDATFYIYGNDCQNAVLELEAKKYIKITNFSFDKNNETLKHTALGVIEKVNFSKRNINGKEEDVCFKLAFKSGNFLDKFIVSSKESNYLFMPFYQEVKVFTSLDEVQDAYSNNALYPSSIDAYYHE